MKHHMVVYSFVLHASLFCYLVLQRLLNHGFYHIYIKYDSIIALLLSYKFLGNGNQSTYREDEQHRSKWAFDVSMSAVERSTVWQR